MVLVCKPEQETLFHFRENSSHFRPVSTNMYWYMNMPLFFINLVIFSTNLWIQIRNISSLIFLEQMKVLNNINLDLLDGFTSWFQPSTHKFL